jgi:hypothetical protein
MDCWSRSGPQAPALPGRKPYHRMHKVLAYIEYRAVSGVFRTIDPPPPLPLASAFSPRTKGGGVHNRRGLKGCGVNISEDARHWISLLQYNPSTIACLSSQRMPDNFIYLHSSCLVGQHEHNPFLTGKTIQ